MSAAVAPCVLAAVLPLAIGCGSCTEAASRAERGAQPATAPPDTPEPEPEPPPPPPKLRIRTEPSRTGLSLSVQNRDAEPVRLRSAVRIERRTAGGFEAVDTSFDLRAHCAQPPPECLSLIPGAELRPPAWDPSVGGVQCADDGSDADAEALPTGDYRMVVTTCEHSLEIASAPFTLP
ncbi:MAG: hypothetical protein PVI30_25515 [Myxococcales bacterium]